jgi:hypothetical protein
MPLVSRACSLEASRSVTNGIPLGCPLFLPVDTVNCVQTLKGGGVVWTKGYKIFEAYGHGARYFEQGFVEDARHLLLPGYHKLRHTALLPVLPYIV